MQNLPQPDPRVLLLHDLHETTRHAELGFDPTAKDGPSLSDFVIEVAQAVASVVRERYCETMLGS